MIVDDEPLARDLMADNISKVDFMHIAATCANITEANNTLAQEDIDLIFLDIEMPDISGISFLQNQNPDAMVIITSAYEKYALEGYQFNVIDYLIKPISLERFLKAANKALEMYELNQNKLNNTQDEIKHIFVKSEFKIVKIDIEDIQFIESMKDYVKIFRNNKAIFTLMTMKSLEELLPVSKFVRVHRSFMVSLAHIDYIGKSKIHIGEFNIPISNNYREYFFSQIQGNI